MNGFQLLELLVVLAMISMLGALSVPIYSHYAARAQHLAAAHALAQAAVAKEQQALSSRGETER
jgi:Tfp pilus assembly major pilin PilA